MTGVQTCALPISPVAPVAAVAGAQYVEPARFDFRRVGLDDTVIGTTQACDVSRVDARKTATGPVLVDCMGHGNGMHASRIELTAPDSVVATLAERTQLAVKIDGTGHAGTGADAAVTLVEIAGQLEPPEPPSRCLCDDDHKLGPDGHEPTAPAPFAFSNFHDDRDKYWGTTQICNVTTVGEIMKSSPESREYSIGRIFDPAELAYAATVYCTWKGGGDEIIVGSDSLDALLSLASGQSIRVELGWVKHWESRTTAKLRGIVYMPD